MGKPSQNTAIHILAADLPQLNRLDRHLVPCKTCTLFGNQGLSGSLLLPLISYFFFLVLLPSSSLSTHFPFLPLLCHVWTLSDPGGRVPGWGVQLDLAQKDAAQAQE